MKSSKCFDQRTKPLILDLEKRAIPRSPILTLLSILHNVDSREYNLFTKLFVDLDIPILQVKIPFECFLS